MVSNTDGQKRVGALSLVGQALGFRRVVDENTQAYKKLQKSHKQTQINIIDNASKLKVSQEKLAKHQKLLEKALLDVAAAEELFKNGSFFMSKKALAKRLEKARARATALQKEVQRLEERIEYRQNRRTFFLRRKSEKEDAKNKAKFKIIAVPVIAAKNALDIQTGKLNALQQARQQLGGDLKSLKTTIKTAAQGLKAATAARIRAEIEGASAPLELKNAFKQKVERARQKEDDARTKHSESLGNLDKAKELDLQIKQSEKSVNKATKILTAAKAKADKQILAYNAKQAQKRETGINVTLPQPAVEQPSQSKPAALSVAQQPVKGVEKKAELTSSEKTAAAQDLATAPASSVTPPQSKSAVEQPPQSKPAVPSVAPEPVKAAALEEPVVEKKDELTSSEKKAKAQELAVMMQKVDRNSTKEMTDLHKEIASAGKGVLNTPITIDGQETNLHELAKSKGLAKTAALLRFRANFPEQATAQVIENQLSAHPTTPVSTPAKEGAEHSQPHSIKETLEHKQESASVSSTPPAPTNSSHTQGKAHAQERQGLGG